MITKNQAINFHNFIHATLKNADNSPMRCRASGKCKTWKTRPKEFKLPVKHGLYDNGYITNENAGNWKISN